jgi:hypothetical protein
LRPLQLRYVPDVPRLNVDPPRLNVCPPRGDIEVKCPPCPPPPRGAAFTADAVNVTAAKQLKNSMSFAFIDYLVVYSIRHSKTGRVSVFSRLPLKISPRL